MTTAPPPMTDRNIIEVRKAQVGRYGTVDPTKPYADSIAFARAIIAARDAHWQATIAANPVERRVPSVVDLCAGPLHGFDDHCDPVAEPQAGAVRWGVDWGTHGDRTCVSIIKKHADGKMEVVATEYEPERKAAPQQAEAVPPGYVLVPVEPTLEMGWAYLDAANAKDPLRHHVFNHAGYRAMIRAAIAQQKGGV